MYIKQFISESVTDDIEVVEEEVTQFPCSRDWFLLAMFSLH